MPMPRWSTAEMEQTVAGGGTVLVDLRADWCPQCGPQERVLERLQPAFEERVTFGSVDVEANAAVVERYRVQGLPTMLVFRSGELATTLSGFRRAPEVRQALENLLHEVNAS